MSGMTNRLPLFTLALIVAHMLLDRARHYDLKDRIDALETAQERTK